VREIKLCNDGVSRRDGLGRFYFHCSFYLNLFIVIVWGFRWSCAFHGYVPCLEAFTV
jgi:hypothetical protein